MGSGTARSGGRGKAPGVSLPEAEQPDRHDGHDKTGDIDPERVDAHRQEEGRVFDHRVVHPDGEVEDLQLIFSQMAALASSTMIAPP